MKIDTSKSLEIITSDLINIPSETGNEKQIADTIYETMKSLDYEADYRTGNTLIYNFELGLEKTIALVGHLDTVKPKSKDHTTPKIEDGKLFGLGAVDVKNNLASMLKLSYELRKGTFTPRQNLQLVFYEGEEGPLPNGMTKLINNEFFKDTDFALVFEPTDLKYGVGCLGRIYGHVHIKGKAAHSATPWKGENAEKKSISLRQKIADESEKFYPSKHKWLEYRESFDLAPTPYVNLSNNVVPDLAIVAIDYRYAPFKDKKTAETEFISKIGPLPGREDEIKIIEKMPSCFIELDKSPFVINGIESMILQGWSDIAQLNALTTKGDSNVQAINFGPGKIEYAHKLNEHIVIADHHKFYDLLKRHL